MSHRKIKGSPFLWLPSYLYWLSFAVIVFKASHFLIVMPSKHLGEKLKQIRLKAGLSQTALIRALNYKALYPYQISEFERGERQPPLLLALAYAKLGGVSLYVLADDELALE